MRAFRDKGAAMCGLVRTWGARCGLEPSVVTYTASISECGEEWQSAKALQCQGSRSYPSYSPYLGIAWWQSTKESAVVMPMVAQLSSVVVVVVRERGLKKMLFQTSPSNVALNLAGCVAF